MLKSYKDLKIWSRSYELCLDIYKITGNFLKQDRYGEVLQLRERDA
ncbi:MAG: four helix bundle protein [Deltaproteobacteria bacterium]|nr:four helix bundle protein [Deltaproteobacteria bacterium]